MIGIGILGFTGQMNGAVTKEILHDQHCRLAATVKNDVCLEYLGAGGVLFTRRPERIITCGAAEIIIDFTSPDVAPKFARLASEVGKPFVSGTAGLNKDGMATLHRAAEVIPVLYLPDASVSKSGQKLYELANDIVAAALWLHKKPAGFYGMEDVFPSAGLK